MHFVRKQQQQHNNNNNNNNDNDNLWVVYQQCDVIHQFMVLPFFTCPAHTFDVHQDRIPSAAKW